MKPVWNSREARLPKNVILSTIAVRDPSRIWSALVVWSQRRLFPMRVRLVQSERLRMARARSIVLQQFGNRRFVDAARPFRTRGHYTLALIQMTETDPMSHFVRQDGQEIHIDRSEPYRASIDPEAEISVIELGQNVICPTCDDLGVGAAVCRAAWAKLDGYFGSRPFVERVLIA
jgi:hypothetical protein